MKWVNYDDDTVDNFIMLVLQDDSWLDLKEKNYVFMDLELGQSCEDFHELRILLQYKIGAVLFLHLCGSTRVNQWFLSNVAVARYCGPELSPLLLLFPMLVEI